MSESGSTSVGGGTAESIAVGKQSAQGSVFLVSYPKVIFLYPTLIVSVACAIVMWLMGGAVAGPEAAAEAGATAETTEPATGDAEAEVAAAENTVAHWCGRVFLAVLGLNLVVISFEFPRTTSLTWFFAISTVSIAVWFLFTQNKELAPAVLHGLLSIKPAATASFYLIFSGILVLLFVAVLISRRMDFWEVRGNELLHHHGVLSNMERFSAPNLRIDKEITDLFEYMLLRSGRLIIHARNESRAIVLENVLGIDRKEEQITQMLGALQVRVHESGD